MTESYDAMIVGFGISGIAAALELKKLRKKVILFELERESAGLSGQYLVGGFELASVVESGALFRRKMGEWLLRESIPCESLGIAEIEDTGSNFTLKKRGDATPFCASKLIFAPAGVLSAPPSEAWAAKAWNWVSAHLETISLGQPRKPMPPVSLCAWSDASFYKDKNVVVWGHGSKLIDQALFLADFARKVILLTSDSGTLIPTILSVEFDRRSNIEVRSRVEVKDVFYEDNCIQVALNSQEKLNADALFIAKNPSVNVDLIKNMQNDRVVLAGIINGIDYYDYGALYADGKKAAFDVGV